LALAFRLQPFLFLAPELVYSPVFLSFVLFHTPLSEFMMLRSLTFVLAAATLQQAVTAAPSDPLSSCLVLPGDPSWPASAVWRQAMPEVEKPKPKGNFKHPDYRLEATTTAEVISAVKFAKEHNIRFTVLNSGYVLCFPAQYL
jgi:hypothetical protein